MGIAALLRGKHQLIDRFVCAWAGCDGPAFYASAQTIKTPPCDEVIKFISNKITYISYNSRFKNVIRIPPFAPYHFVIGRVKNSAFAYNRYI